MAKVFLPSWVYKKASTNHGSTNTLLAAIPPLTVRTSPRFVVRGRQGPEAIYPDAWLLREGTRSEGMSWVRSLFGRKGAPVGGSHASEREAPATVEEYADMVTGADGQQAAWKRRHHARTTTPDDDDDD